MGCRLWGCKESDTTKRQTHTHSILLRNYNVGTTLTLLGVKNYENVLTQILRHFNDRYSVLGLARWR